MQLRAERLCTFSDERMKEKGGLELEKDNRKSARLVSFCRERWDRRSLTCRLGF